MSDVSRLPPHAFRARRLTALGKPALALGRQLAGRRGAESTGSFDETSWLEYEGLTGLSGLGEAPEPDSDGCMCINSA